jgi:hypothetical protein
VSTRPPARVYEVGVAVDLQGAVATAAERSGRTVAEVVHDALRWYLAEVLGVLPRGGTRRAQGTNNSGGER